MKRDTLWRHDTVRVAGDTTARIAIPLGTLTDHDTAFARCERLNRSCAREHAADSLVIAELRASLALARTGTAIPPPPRSCTKETIAGGAIGAILDHFARR